MESDNYGQGNIALLVDGQNISPSAIDVVFKEISKYGQVRIKRLYGDWSNGQMGKWKEKAIEFAITPQQVITNVKGKNAADIRLVIDAMDLLAKRSVETICIVANDSDYSQLATKLKEEGMRVIGVGRSDSHRSLQNACDRYIFIENLVHDEQLAAIGGKQGGDKEGTGEMTAEVPAAIKLDPREAVPVLTQAINSAADDSGRVHLSVLKKAALRIDPSFDERTFGKSKPIDLIKALSAYFILEQDRKNGPGGAYVKIKPGH